jgi:hypothetical protein
MEHVFVRVQMHLQTVMLHLYLRRDFYNNFYMWAEGQPTPMKNSGCALELRVYAHWSELQS